MKKIWIWAAAMLILTLTGADRAQAETEKQVQDAIAAFVKADPGLKKFLESAIGYGLGVGAAAWFGQMSQNAESKLAFYMPSVVLVGTGLAVMMISILSSVLSLRRVLALEPAVVFQG